MLSSGIVLYVLAGGIYKYVVSIVLGVVEFDHTELLEFSILIIFIYFVFRYLSDE